MVENKIKLFSKMKQQMRKIHDLAKRKNWENIRLIIEPPAMEKEVLNVESELEIKFPQELKDLFLECSRHVDFYYNHKLEVPNEFKNLSSGELFWNLGNYVEQYQYYKDWVEASLEPIHFDPDFFEQQKELMNNKVPLMEIGNGDLIVVGYNPSEVIYFSHDWGELHGKKLANTLFEFLDYYTQVGFIGAEEYSFKPFLAHSSDNVIYNKSNIVRWQQLLEIDIL